MVTGILRKFEPTEKGITVLIHATDEQMTDIVALFRQPVVILPANEATPADRTAELASIRIQLEKLMRVLEA
jgi:hypothetical protein